MKRKKTNSVNKGMAMFFVLLACLFAILACVKALQNLDKAPQSDPSESASAHAGETVQETETTETAASTETTATSTAAASTVPNAGDKVIYLTFDDGPTENTVSILNVLDRYGVRGTFFVVHSYDGCEEQIRQIHARGHCVGLHTYSHLYSIYRSQETYFEDLGKISDLVYKATGTRSMVVRFPGGSSNTISRKYCQGIMTALTQELPKRGYAYFDWNVDSSDAVKVSVPAQTIVRNSTAAIGKMNQIVLLMHDAKAKTTTVDALPGIIEAYRDAGYRFDVLSTSAYPCHHTVLN